MEAVLQTSIVRDTSRPDRHHRIEMPIRKHRFRSGIADFDRLLNVGTRLVLIGTHRLPKELDMKIEHVAFNVPDPLAMGRWYVEHLGMQIKRRTVDPPYAHFLADDSGTVMIEIYGNDDAPVPDYEAIHPMSLHLAFVAKDMELDIKRLITAGAKLIAEPQTAPNGDTHAMLRDPWGFVVQLVTRAKPMI